MKTFWTHRDEHSFNIVDSPVCHTEDGWDFWALDFPSVFEPFTMKWIRDFCDPWHDFLDIGAWVGPTTLFASRFAREVDAVEPDPTAFELLQQNVELNCDNVCLFNGAISTTKGMINMYSRINPGDSMTNITGDGTLLGEVRTYTLDEFLVSHGRYSLMKIDIEGAESSILPANKDLLGEFKVPLILSFHGTFYKDRDSISNIKDAISVYDHFYNEDGVAVDLNSISPNFDTLLCL